MRGLVLIAGIATIAVLAFSSSAQSHGSPPEGVRQGALLGQIVYGAPAAESLRISHCESVHWTDFVNGPGTLPPNGDNPQSYRTPRAAGAWQFLRSTWDSTPYRSWPRTNHVIAGLAAGWLWLNSGRSWRQWVCQP